MEHIVKHELPALQPKQRKVELGYLPNEAEAVYLCRMQAIVAWYGALLQTSTSFLHSEMRLLEASSTPHPFCKGSVYAFNTIWGVLAQMLNLTKWRHTRFLLQAFLAVVGFELNSKVGRQTRKLLHVMASPEFNEDCRKTHVSPQDDDRASIFEVFVKEKMDKGVQAPGNKADARFLAKALDQNLALSTKPNNNNHGR